MDKLPGSEQLKTRDAAIINSDHKANTQKLIQQIEQQLGRPITLKADSKPTDIQTEPAYNMTGELPLSKELLQTTVNKANHNTKDNIDVVLQQLGRQLLASLAKTQLNQLETINSRNPANNDPIINNSWSLEIPIMNGKQADNMQLLIQQETAKDTEANCHKQWRVLLDFDLHKLGKMSVELFVFEKAVSAIVWTELKHAHQLVQKEVEQFKVNLQNIGVNVTKVECKMGLPKKNDNSLQPLVDVRT